MRVLVVEPRCPGAGVLDRYRWIENLGFEPHVLYGEGEPGFWPAARYRVAGSRHIDDLLAVARDWHRERGFAGVVALAEPGVMTAAVVAERLGLPGVGVDAARASRNKLLMRLGHRRAGAPHPRFRHVPTLREALAASREVGFPAVLKPTLGASSNLVFRVDDERRLREVFPVADEGSRTMPALAAEAEGFDLGPPGLLLESYLDGGEHLIEACVWDGEVCLGSIVDRLEPTGQAIDENLHCAPTALVPDQLDEVRSAVTAAVRGQRLRRSVLQVEVRFHRGRPYIVEIGARPGGGGLDRMARLSAGYDPIRCAVEVAVGVRPAMGPYRPTGLHTAAMVLLSDGGRVDGVTVPPGLSESDPLFLFRLSIRVGDIVRRPPDGNDILGFLGAIGRSRDDAIATLFDHANRIDLRVVPIAWD